MQKIKNVTQTVPYYLMPQNRPLTGLADSTTPSCGYTKNAPRRRDEGHLNLKLQ